ncbi:MAG: exo-alpha-sialidase [Planctomycetales bacterium]|nr:exo-alpha-sialidase [Planctomycetales bacterium]
MATRRSPVWMYGLVMMLVVGGVALGYLMPERGESEKAADLDRAKTATAEVSSAASLVEKTADEASATETVVSEDADDSAVSFDLTRLDFRDQIQAPQIATDGADRVWLAWDSRTGDEEHTLFLSTSVDGGRGFDSPRAIRTASVYRWEVMVRGQPGKRESRLWPQIAWQAGRLLVSWVEPLPDNLATLRLYVSESEDGGATFGEPRVLSSTDAVRPTFVAFHSHADGRIAASWLYNRHRAQQPFAAIVSGQTADESLVFAGQDEKGICPCCNTAVLLADDGSTLVAFRNHKDGFRDMWLAVKPADDSTFLAPVPIAGDRWKFDGCPHDGPSMAIHDGMLHVVWMDAHEGPQRVYHARARLGDWSFDVQPLDAEAAGTQGHPTLAIDVAGVLHVAWDESLDPASAESPAAGHRHGPPQGSGRAIVYAMSRDGGQSFAAGRKLAVRPGAFQTRPAVMPLADGSLGFAWNELSDAGKRIVWHRDDAPAAALAVRE